MSRRRHLQRLLGAVAAVMLAVPVGVAFSAAGGPGEGVPGSCRSHLVSDSHHHPVFSRPCTVIRSHTRTLTISPSGTVTQTATASPTTTVTAPATNVTSTRTGYLGGGLITQTSTGTVTSTGSPTTVATTVTPSTTTTIDATSTGTVTATALSTVTNSVTNTITSTTTITFGYVIVTVTTTCENISGSCAP